MIHLTYQVDQTETTWSSYSFPKMEGDTRYSFIDCPNCLGLNVGVGPGFCHHEMGSSCLFCFGLKVILCYSCYKVCKYNAVTDSCMNCMNYEKTTSPTVDAATETLEEDVKVTNTKNHPYDVFRFDWKKRKAIPRKTSV